MQRSPRRFALRRKGEVRRRPSVSVPAPAEVRVRLPVFSFVKMLDGPTPLDSYRLHWDECFDGDFIVALSLSDPRQHLPVAILKLSDSPRQILGVARRRNAGLEATVLDLLRKLQRT